MQTIPPLQPRRQTANFLAQRDQLFAIVRNTPWLMACLHEARRLDLMDWFIAAGAIRSTVWDHLHGRDCRATPSDIDLVYFDPATPHAEDASLQAQLGAIEIGEVGRLEWDVTNQAQVHTWCSKGQTDVPPLAPLQSTQHGLSTWPETATTIGVRLEADDALTLAAPLGLEDLFALRLRWNSRLVRREVFLQRVREKRFLERWPKLTLVEGAKVPATDRDGRAGGEG